MASEPSLKGRALRWLAQREHSRAELARKLRGYVQGEDETALIEPLLDELAAKGFLSDPRAAESLLAGKGQRMGQHRLRQVLHSKGLEPELIATTLARAQATELERARAIWQRKFGVAPADARERARQARFLAGRGFGAEVIARALREGGSEQADD